LHDLACSPYTVLQLLEAEQRYAEIYEEYEKAREWYTGVEQETHKAAQEYLRDKRQWQEASEAAAKEIADLKRQLAAERKARDAAETKLATLQVGAGCLVCDALHAWKPSPPWLVPISASPRLAFSVARQC
jgi:hypothetical protein